MGKTYPRVIEKIREEVPAKTSRNEFCRRTGINQNSYDRYVNGISEPTQASLEKLAAYFYVSVAWLRGGTVGPLERLLEGLKIASGVKRYGMDKAVAEKTGYSEGLVAKVLKGHATLTPQFIQNVCAAFGLSGEWVELGDFISEWRERVATKFYEETAEKASPESIEAGNIDHQRPNFSRLLRLHSMLTGKGIPECGRISLVSSAIGFTEAETAGILTGAAAFCLTDSFLQAVCAKFSFNKAWIELGDDMPIIAGNVRLTMKEYEAKIQKGSVLLDAPTQEIVNDMKKLTGSNRLVFLKKVKPIIQAMIEEQVVDNSEAP